jgi:hypothetical protein
MKNLRIALASLASTTLLAACSNPFLEHYQGERWPKTSSAEVVLETPSASEVRWIGHSNFDSFDAVTSSQAVAAAETVGADRVEWHDQNLGLRKQWTSSPVLWNQWDGQMFNPAVPIERNERRFEARFYRSKSLGGRAISGEPEPSAKDAAAPSGKGS